LAACEAESCALYHVCEVLQVKYYDVDILFFTEEQDKLPQELKDDIPFSDMQVRAVRFYQIPIALTVSMENDEVRGSILYFDGGGLRLFSKMSVVKIHELIKLAFD